MSTFRKVIKEREAFFSKEDGYQMIASSISEPAWLDQLPKKPPVKIVAEGVFDYLSEAQVKTLLNILTVSFSLRGHFL